MKIQSFVSFSSFCYKIFTRSRLLFSFSLFPHQPAAILLRASHPPLLTFNLSFNDEDNRQDENRGCGEQDPLLLQILPTEDRRRVENVSARMERMVAHGPAFCDITWGTGGSTAGLTLEIANRMQNIVCVETMMHLTCTNMPVEKN